MIYHWFCSYLCIKNVHAMMYHRCLSPCPGTWTRTWMCWTWTWNRKLWTWLRHRLIGKLTWATCNCFGKIDVRLHQKFHIFVFKLLFTWEKILRTRTRILKYEFVFALKKVKLLGICWGTFTRRLQIDKAKLTMNIAILQSNIAI
jgi:hypothetical protein